MAIEPRQLLEAISIIGPNTPIEHYMSNLYQQLPRCIARAIAILQCTQLERGYEAQVLRLQTELNFDLHQHIKDQVSKLLTQRR